MVEAALADHPWHVAILVKEAAGLCSMLAPKKVAATKGTVITSAVESLT
jgi:hypothetical protein